MSAPLPRDSFIAEIFKAAKKDKEICFLCADLGAQALDEFRDVLPDQFIHVGISEQNMVDIAAGLAIDGKKVFCYAMAPFVTLRCFEQIKVAIGHMNLPVTFIGVGVGFAYDDAGPTHYATEDIACMRSLAGIEILTPADDTSVVQMAKLCCEKPAFRYIRLDRKNLPEIYQGKDIFTKQGFNVVREGKDIALVASGYMLHSALEVAKHFSEKGRELAVIDIFSLKPISPKVQEEFKKYKKLITLEEHFLSAGFGSAVLEYCADHELEVKIKRLGVADHYYFENGGRKYVHKLAQIDVPSLIEKIGKE